MVFSCIQTFGFLDPLIASKYGSFQGTITGKPLLIDVLFGKTVNHRIHSLEKFEYYWVFLSTVCKRI